MNQKEFNHEIISLLDDIARDVSKLFDGEVTSYNITAVRERIERLYLEPVEDNQ